MSNLKKIAVIGSGISGLSAAYFLKDNHEVHLFEKLERAGGHSNTVMVDMEGKSIPVDTGFIVFNNHTYPNLVKFFKHLDVPIIDSDMSFSVSLDHGKLEYAGTNLDTLFCQRSNLTRLDFWRMVKDIFRFNRMARIISADIGYDITLENFLNKHGFSKPFRDWYLYPMTSAIWSMPFQGVGSYPARTLIDFFHNHGLLRAITQHPWLTVEGGSQTYVKTLITQLENVHLNTEVKSVFHDGTKVQVSTSQGKYEFDGVVLATDGAAPLSLLQSPSTLQKEILGGFKVSRNKAILHWDLNLMPKRRKAWTSWNYLLQSGGSSKGVSLSYWMNRLQAIESKHPLIVTLNPVQLPDPEKTFYETEYFHPLFDAETIKMQDRLSEIQGVDNIWYAGAYHGYGFHEDGLKSGMQVARKLGGRVPWQT